MHPWYPRNALAKQARAAPCTAAHAACLTMPRCHGILACPAVLHVRPRLLAVLAAVACLVLAM